MPKSGGGKSASPGGMGGMDPASMQQLMSMFGGGGGGSGGMAQAQAGPGGMGGMGGMPREKMPSQYDSVEAQNAAAAQWRMQHGQVGQGNDMGGMPPPDRPGQAYQYSSAPNSMTQSGMQGGMFGKMPGGMPQFDPRQGGMPPQQPMGQMYGQQPKQPMGQMYGQQQPMGQMYGQQSFRSPYDMSGGMGPTGMGARPGMANLGNALGNAGGMVQGGGMKSPLDYAMAMQQQRAAAPKPGQAPGASSPGLLAQKQQAAAKVAQQQKVEKANVQAKALKKKQEQQLRNLKGRNPLLYANATIDDMLSIQGGSGGGG